MKNVSIATTSHFDFSKQVKTVKAKKDDDGHVELKDKDSDDSDVSSELEFELE